MKTPEVDAARRELNEAIAAWVEAGLDGPSSRHWRNLELRIDLLMVRVESAARKAQLQEDFEYMRKVMVKWPP